MTIDELLDCYTGPVHFVSTGAELAALEGININRWAPELFVIEDNFRGADRRVSQFLARFRYVERLHMDHNVFYIKAADERCLGFLEATGSQ